MPSRGIRTGIDLVDIPRFGIVAGRRGGAFLDRIFTPAELASSPALQSLAGGFAAKEAFLKALGTGLSDGISWHDVEVVHGNGGQPGLVLARRAAELLGSGQASLSISHTSTTAVAVVVISGGD